MVTPSEYMPARSLALQRSVSSRLMRADIRLKGEDVWIEDEKEVWVLAEMVRQDETILTVRRKDTGKILEIDQGFAETHPCNPKVVSDMAAMHHIHEPGILHNLRERAKLENQRPNTFMGTILITVNPLRPTPNPDFSKFINRPLDPELPHPFAIAELAYHHMRLGAGRTKANQSIVVSGESGAGKTEASKIIISFLAHRSEKGTSNLEQKVADSSPILESFGNAKTPRNDNSSRFGKFLKMQFTSAKQSLAGAFIETYLLEKSRVLAQGEGNRNFHILYELVAGGAESDLADELKLGTAETYPILSRSGCITVDGVDDAEKFRAVQKALDTIGIRAQMQMQIWRMLAAVLHLSNLKFDKLDTEEGDIAVIYDRAALAILASLLGVEEAVIESMLTQRAVRVRGYVITPRLKVPEADLTRAAIVKSLYEALFLWIVGFINTSLNKGDDSLPFIGVLDICGFENFARNDLEQLLINFTGESLQNTFNKKVFNNELALFEEEGIEVTVSSYPDNTQCLTMLSDRRTGIIPSLDNVCAEPNPVDSRYLDGLHKLHDRHPDFPRTKPRDMHGCFWVKHYAGKVKYTVEGWVERNMDFIPISFVETLQNSNNQVVRESAEMYGKGRMKVRTRSRVNSNKKSLVRPTVAKGFMASMRNLNETLVRTACNFLRCIKPNAAMKLGVFDSRYVVDQLQCLGILQTCEVLKVGFPTRITYTDLKEVLGSKITDAEKLFSEEPETSLVACLLDVFEVPSDSYRLGKTRVFFGAGQIFTLQKILNGTPAEKGPHIFRMLQNAVADRKMAKAAAAEANVALARGEKAMADAKEATAGLLESESESDEEDSSFERQFMTTPSSVSEEELYSLKYAAKKARAAGSTAPEVKKMLEAVDEDGIGTYAKGCRERVLTASNGTLADVEAAAAIADKLEAEIKAVRIDDELTALRELEDDFHYLKIEFKEAKKLAKGAEEAAAKGQADKTKEMADFVKAQATVMEGQSLAIIGDAKRATEAPRQLEKAFQRAKATAEVATAAAEKAKTAFRTLKSVITAAEKEEQKAFDDMNAKIQREMQVQEAAAAAAAAVAAEEEADAALAAAAAAEKEAQEAKERAAEAEVKAAQAQAEAAQAHEEAELAVAAATEEEVKDAEATAAPQARANFAAKAESSRDTKSTISVSEDGDLDLLSPSTALPVRFGLIKARSKSVKQIMASRSMQTPEPSPPPRPRTERDADMGGNVSQTLGPKAAPVQKDFKTIFANAGKMEGKLMKQTRYMARWRPYFFELEDGYFSYSQSKTLISGRKTKRMRLTTLSTTAFTNVNNCFCVLTDKTGLYLIAQSWENMVDWMTAINAHIYQLFLRKFTPPDDDYWSQGIKTQRFYGLNVGASSLWIYTHPEENAPRTGEGVFVEEVIEITQILEKGDVFFFRIAGNRGWVRGRDSKDGEPCMVEVAGELIKDNRLYQLSGGLNQATTRVLCGPSRTSEYTGETFDPGDYIQAVERFTPAKGGNIVFIKLLQGGGWVPFSTR